MDRPPININLPDPLKHFAKDPPAWKFAALVAVLITMVFLAYLWRR